MISHRIARTGLRAAAAGTVLALPLVAGPAFADTPAAWPRPPHVSGLDFLLVLFLIPAGIAIVISLLVVVPSMVKGDSYQKGETWRGEGEWFGGPTKGIDTPRAEKATDSGGASADW